ncbi:unnamed protein product [Ceutorhynchus assimilis]|uniref:Nucleoprotein TPR n=1 Tax=Ceutorhynchus assimilis TaxID=467358 RepID=A0A9P0GT09_9CUCU|nr:unnamed protein product [Ceutorhynchus assimilis]
MDSQPNIFEPAVTPEEWQKVPSEIGQKLVNFVNEKFEEFITSKALLETKSFNSEQLLTEVKAQVETVKGENENLKARLAAASVSINELESQITTMSAELTRLHTYSNKLEADTADFRHQRNLAVDERDECFKMMERRKSELERMQMDLDTLTKQLEDATRTKCEALAEAEEVKSMKVSLEYREKRLEQDRELMQTKMDSLENDVRERTEEILNMRRDSNSRCVQLETKLSDKTQELAVAVDQCNSLLELNQALTTRNEELAQKLLDLNETHSKTNESYVCEIEAKTKMANVYRAMSEQSQKHAEELQKALTEVQELLNLNTEKYGELETKLKESELSCEEIVAKKNDYIAMLTKELETANEVIEECKNESLSRNIEGISNMAANISRGLTNDSSGRTMSYTTLYSQYVQAKEQLATKDEECARLNNYIACIVQEVEEKGPLIKQLRSEYSECLDMQEALKTENEALTSELEQLREERAENHRMESKVARENQRMKKEVADLSRQVVHLLQEVEHSRIGSSSVSSDNDMSDSVCSADIISKRLVTFNDIAELQATNQKLLALVRELTERQEEVESYDPAAVAKLQQKLKELQESQMELLQEREQQAKMMTTLRNQRDMFKKSFGHDMIGAGGDLSERSFPNMRHQDDSNTKSQSDSKSDEEVHELRQQIEKYKKQLDQAKEEYDQYRKERLEHEKIILEQIETIRNESKELQKANGKLASQSEYNEERFKVFQNNTEVYKKQIQALEKQNKIYSEALIKHEQSASYLKEDALKNQTRASVAEVQLANITKENALLRDAEKRLTRESEMLRRHTQQQNLITSNIELIKATLERNEAESKLRLESKLDEAHLECSALRRRLEEEQNHFRELTQHLEKATKHAQERMEENKIEADKLRQELTETRQELSNKTAHIENLSKQLKSSVFQIQDVSVESRKLREIEQQLADSQAEVNSLKLKLKSTKEASENYFNIAQNAEKQLKDLSLENEKYVQTISEKEQQVQRLTDKLGELQAELSIQMDDQDINSADIKNQKQQLQEELHGQSLTLKQTREQLELAKSDLKLLSEQLKASEHKYAREVALHSSDLQLLQNLKQELQAAKDSYKVMDQQRKEAVDNLQEYLLSKEEQTAILNSEKEKLEVRFKSMDEQNTLLLDQIEALNRQLTIIQGQADHNSSANSSLIEDSADSNQLLTILKYLRQEKDLAVSKADVIEAEHFRLKSQFEAVQKQLQEAKSLYEAERQKSEIKNVTAAKHAEVLRQMETFNAVADSNRSLRQERDALADDIRKLQARAEQLEVSIAPLQENNRDLMQKADQMQTENISLRAECTRWRQRANLLIEKTNRTSPEDWKKLQTERETLAKQLTIERGNNAKLTEDNATLKARLDKMEQEVKSLKMQNHGLVEEVSRLKEQVALLGSNLKQVQENRDEVNKTNAKLTEDNRLFSEELAVKETSVTELKNNLAQVKKIAKKYKTQYEEQVKEIEIMKEQQSEQMSTMEKQLELEKVGLEDRLSQLEISHKEALEQLKLDKEQQEQNFTKEMEALKQSSQEKEDKFKSLFKSAKERIVTLTEQNTALLEEVDKQVKDSAMTSTSSSNSVGVSVNTDGNKDNDLMEKIQQLEQEKEALQEKLQQEKLARAQELEALKLKPNSCSSAMMSSDKSSMERPTADIKPIPGHSTNTQTQSVPIQPWRNVGEPPLASIRPMSQQLRTAAVLPTTQTPSAAVMVPPQQQVHTTGSSSIEALSSSSPTSSHTDYVPATSSASSPMLNPRQVAVPPTQSSEDDDSNMQVQAAPTQQQALAVVSPRVEPPSSGSGGATQEQGTSSSSSNTVTTTQAGLKRQRDSDTDSCQAEEKNAIKQQSKRTRLQQASDSGLEVEYQVPTSSQRDQDDDNVIVLESDDEAIPDEGECDDQDEPDEAEVYDDMEEGMEPDNYDDDDCQDVEDEEEADNEVEVISDSSEVPNQSHGETEEAREAAENSMDEEQAQSEAISSGTDAAAAGPSSSFSPAVAASPPFSRSRLVPPLHRHQNLLDESALDDGIVPSTPTLFAPRRSDGFGEAVSSPHVPSSATGRFTFNESQLVQPSRGGGDYSISEVPQVDNVDNSTGRSVPTTPLQSSPQESIPNLIDEHGADGQAQSDEIPQISISTEEEEGRGEGSSAEVMMGPPSQAGTSSEENRQENEVEVEDAVSSEGEKQPQAEEGEEEGREAEASPSPTEVRRSSRAAPSARRSARLYPGSRGPSRMGPTPIVWGDQRHPHYRNQQQQQQQQHERNRSPNYGSGGNVGRSMTRRPRTRMQRPPFGGRF